MAGFLTEPEPSDGIRRIYDDDLADGGYVMNSTRVWAYGPEIREGLFALMGQATAGHLSFRQRAILVAASMSAFGDSSCSLAWGTKLAGASSPEIAGSVLAGEDQGLEAAERTLAEWARAVARDPSAVTAEQVAALREAGFDDPAIFAATVYVALRMAFATVNDALGAQPDAELVDGAPAPVREIVTFGRPAAVR